MQNDAETIFEKVVEKIHPLNVINKEVIIDKNFLFIKGEKVCNLDEFKRIVIIGVGTASGAMAKALEEKLVQSSYINKVDVENSLIVVKQNHKSKLKFLKQIESTHPIPDQICLECGKKLIDIADKCCKDTLVFSLISGGSSSLVEYYEAHPDLSPDLKTALTIDDNRMVTSTLHNSGCSIGQVNTVRKHLSMIKGGELAKRLYPATTINLIFSDVLSNDFDIIGSGMTVPDSSTWQDVLDIFHEYNMEGNLPYKVLLLTQMGVLKKLRETPKKDDICFTKVKSYLLAENNQALEYAKQVATNLGYKTKILDLYTDEHEIEHLANNYIKIALKALKDKDRPLCFISTSLANASKYNGKGKSGRNQSLALTVVDKLTKYQYKLSEDDQDSLLFLFASTDGSDGMTDFAGAFANFDQVYKSQQRGLVPHGYLLDNDAYNFFSACGGLFKTGPTNTNVFDIHLILVR